MTGPTKETGLVNAIRRAIREAYPGVWIVKIHGGPQQEAGIPDLIGCLRGRFFAIEVKFQRPGESADHARKRTTSVQQAQIERIRAAGGEALTVLSVAEALQVMARLVDAD